MAFGMEIDMTDRTNPDSGHIITSSDILLHDAETALMYEELRAAIDDGHESMTHADALVEIAAIRAENVELRTGYAAARLEIESLQARIKTMAEEHADELMVAHLDGRMRAAQQEAQEPVAWYVTGCSRLLDEDEAKAEARHIGGTARAIPLYTAPHADSVLEDAERLDWLLLHISGAEFRRIGVHYSGNASRADVDAARKQGENHD